jgi:hypothetical protein
VETAVVDSRQFAGKIPHSIGPWLRAKQKYCARQASRGDSFLSLFRKRGSFSDLWRRLRLCFGGRRVSAEVGDLSKKIRTVKTVSDRLATVAGPLRRIASFAMDKNSGIRPQLTT